MADRYVIEPDVGFIKEISELGGQDAKKCFQCATCSVACPIAPDTRPFPRKEMIATGWGLKDKLVGNADVWLCHNCGDCTTMCPRGAKPGDVLAAVRMATIKAYAKPRALFDMVNDPKKIPVLLAIPAIIFIVIGLITGLMDFTPDGDEIVHGHFVSTWLVDMIMIPAFFFAIAVFGLGLKNFLADIHANALAEGKTKHEKIDPKGFVTALIRVVPMILRHDKFNECGENQDRATPHMMVLFGFIGLFIVTNIFFVVMYGFQIHGPYSQLNPVKWLGNLAGLSLIIGSALMIKKRLDDKEQLTTYSDWYLVGLAFALGVTGMLSQMTRLAGMASISYLVYFIHLLFVFSLFAYTPFSKLAHLVYRTVALTYAEYAERT